VERESGAGEANILFPLREKDYYGSFPLIIGQLFTNPVFQSLNRG
jgi:hypothetical protein